MDDPTFDLHGYATDTALALARLWVDEAWQHGCTAVTFIHGSGDVIAPPKGYASGLPVKSSTKWALRDAVRDRTLGSHVARRGHKLAPDALTLAIDPCPDPDPLMPWTQAPPPDYE